MGKYDIDIKYSDLIKKYKDFIPSVESMCEELFDELATSKNYPHSKNTTGLHILEMIRDEPKTNLIYRLKREIDYDIISNAGDSPEQQFEMCQLLKLLYMTERRGKAISVTRTGTRKGYRGDYPVVDILAHPSLENISNVYSDTTVYGEDFNTFFLSLYNNINDSQERHEKIYDVERTWSQLSIDLNYYLLSDDAFSKKKEYFCVLQYFNLFITKVIDLFSAYNPAKLPYSEGVLCTFFNILVANHYHCYDTATSNLINVDINKTITKNHIACFRAYEYINFKWTTLACVESYLNYLQDINKKAFSEFCDYDKNMAKLLIRLVVHDEELDEEGFRLLRYALRKARNFAPLIEKQRNTDLSEKIDITLLATIIQEVMDVHKNSIQIENKYYRYTTGVKSLSSAANNFNNAPSITALLWLKRIENRLSFNFGILETQVAKRELEQLFLKIKTYVYRHKNLQHISLVNGILESAINNALREIIDKILNNNPIYPNIKYLNYYCDLIINDLKSSFDQIYK